MNLTSLSAQPRAEKGKNACRRIRVAGRLPAIVYGQKTEPEPISIDMHEFSLLLQHEGHSSIIELDSGASDKTPCVIREILRDPVTDNCLHVDLMRVNLTEETDFTIEVHGRGTAVGVRAGGVLETVTYELDIRCLPTVLPSHIDVDLSALEIGDAVHAGDLTLPEGVTLMSDPDTVLFSVVAPRLEEELTEAEAEAEGELAEPEVVGKESEEEAAEEEE